MLVGSSKFYMSAPQTVICKFPVLPSQCLMSYLWSLQHCGQRASTMGLVLLLYNWPASRDVETLYCFQAFVGAVGLPKSKWSKVTCSLWSGPDRGDYLCGSTVCIIVSDVRSVRSTKEDGDGGLLSAGWLSYSWVVLAWGPSGLGAGALPAFPQGALWFF